MSNLSRISNKMFAYLGLVVVSLSATSCVGRGPIEVYNRYASFDEAYKAIGKLDNKKTEKMINFSSISELKDFSVNNIYLVGLCGHEPYHNKFTDRCGNLNVSCVMTILKNQDKMIYIKQSLELKFNKDDTLVNASEETLKQYYDNFHFGDKEYYSPSELHEFNYNSFDSVSSFKDRYFLIKENNKYLNYYEVLFSKNIEVNFAEETIQEYNHYFYNS